MLGGGAFGLLSPLLLGLPLPLHLPLPLRLPDLVLVLVLRELDVSVARMAEATVQGVVGIVSRRGGAGVGCGGRFRGRWGLGALFGCWGGA